ncbi:DUF433 domain-containing protein [Novosphingobium sp. CECT 9465]|uniref:DUF433 domain-containing protein n=1 Tax=Novosphingobium sp. CECT 9465 TaxID=2829794 RepID=UPI001E61C64E|nr:DUF433 domain-containing protein [Novosphingobium sp. CECT 9465]CAH0496698.1 Putative antitoxin VapB45 [Novosphingobium sp. CECT 9465]
MSDAAFGVGIYTVGEAARMIDMPARNLRRWLSGYDHDGKHEAPLWHPQYDIEDDESLIIGFRDLVEARIVNSLRGLRIGLPTIRRCIARARDLIGDDRPFSTRQFKTDGKSLFLEIWRDVGEPELIDLRSLQGVFSRIVAPSLTGLEFDDEAARRWWLLDGKRTIVADPERSFGQPIVAESGIPTERLAQAVRAEGSVEAVAKLFELRPKLIRDALEYEMTHAPRKAA